MKTSQPLGPHRPELNPALLNVWALRTEYQAACENVAAIENDIRFGNGRSVRAAMAEIRKLRARADADRPYLIAIQDVLAEWRDAEDEYDAALAQVQWARDHLEAVAEAADADPDDIASARSEVKLWEMFVPATPPAERFMPALTAAMQARAEAAGGADKIVSGDDVDRLLMDLRTADEQTLRDARAERQRIGRARDRAEVAAAAAFAAAETRSAEHITAQRDALATEMRVLDVAGRYQVAAAAKPQRQRAGRTARLGARPLQDAGRTTVHHHPGPRSTKPGTHRRTAHPARHRRSRRPKNPVVQHNTRWRRTRES